MIVEGILAVLCITAGFYTLIPSIFMLVTTVTASILEIKMFVPKRNIILLCIGIVLLILTTVLLYDVFKIIFRRKKPLQV